MEEIRHKLKQNKPEITESSLKAYVLNLRKLGGDVRPNHTP